MLTSNPSDLTVRFVAGAWFVVLGLVLGGCSKSGEVATRESKPPAQAAPPGSDERTALDEYIAAPDTNYSYRLVNTIRGKDVTAYILEMTSQAWLTSREVDEFAAAVIKRHGARSATASAGRKPSSSLMRAISS